MGNGSGEDIQVKIKARPGAWVNLASGLIGAVVAGLLAVGAYAAREYSLRPPDAGQVKELSTKIEELSTTVAKLDGLVQLPQQIQGLQTSFVSLQAVLDERQKAQDRRDAEQERRLERIETTTATAAPLPRRR